MKKLTLLLMLALSLQSCIFVVGAAAGAAAIAIVYDHRKVEKILKDQEIANQAVEKLKSDSALAKDAHINVTCFNSVILLTGEATTPELRSEAEDLIRSIPNVTRVYNQITLKGPTSALSRTSDSWITTKIKTLMLANKDLKSSSIKVITESGTVYLMGMVSHPQANIAVNIARQVDGVQKVIKIFQYTD